MPPPRRRDSRRHWDCRTISALAGRDLGGHFLGPRGLVKQFLDLFGIPIRGRFLVPEIAGVELSNAHDTGTCDPQHAAPGQNPRTAFEHELFSSSNLDVALSRMRYVDWRKHPCLCFPGRLKNLNAIGEVFGHQEAVALVLVVPPHDSHFLEAVLSIERQGFAVGGLGPSSPSARLRGGANGATCCPSRRKPRRGRDARDRPPPTPVRRGHRLPSPQCR